ncbi:hypothetical protein TFLX_04985 [Thermoflexales bacterium]|nr:hypothetical protein TFLX_04985 [Thermoflexales bacterium]
MSAPHIFRSSSFSVKNSERSEKPNEDAFVADADRGIFIVADGITSTPAGKYPNPSGGQLAAKVFCETIHQHLVSRSPVTVEDVDTALRLANQEINALNCKQGRYTQANFLDVDYCATVGTVVVGIEGQAQIWHVGDTMVVRKRGTALELLTDSQTQNVIEYRDKIKRSGALPLRDLTVAIRRDFRNNLKARGINGEPVGYGAFTGEPGVFDFLVRRELPLQREDVLLVMSDGFNPLVNSVLENAERTAWFCRRLEQSDAIDWLIQENQALESRSDDKTVIVIRIK